MKQDFILSQSNVKFIPSHIPIHNISNANGVLGLGMESLATYSCAHNNALCAPVQRIIASIGYNTSQILQSDTLNSFGINITDTQGYIDIPSKEMKNKNLISAEVSSPKIRLLYHLQIYNMSVCGIPIFSNITSSWDAIIATSEACLTLPSEFFTTLINWLPVDCYNTKDGVQNSVRACFLRGPIENMSLPEISFQLEENGTILTLPLEALILPTASRNIVGEGYGRKRLCITEFTSLARTAQPYPRKIVFGFRTLLPFYTVFDLHNSRVGLLQKEKNTINQMPTKGCVASAACQEYQVFNPYLNRCETRSCGYYLFTVDLKTGTCRVVRSLSFFLRLF
jgi:hypothetical protein